MIHDIIKNIFRVYFSNIFVFNFQRKDNLLLKFSLFVFQVEKVRDEMKTAGIRPSEEFLESPDTTGDCALDINSVPRITEV